MIQQAWILTVEILSNSSSNFVDIIKWLKKVPEINIDFSTHRNYISWIKFIKQTLNIIYSKLDLKILKLIDQKDFNNMFVQEKFQS
jgi:hypothetical protein